MVEKAHAQVTFEKVSMLITSRCSTKLSPDSALTAFRLVWNRGMQVGNSFKVRKATRIWRLFRDSDMRHISSQEKRFIEVFSS